MIKKQEFSRHPEEITGSLGAPISAPKDGPLRPSWVGGAASATRAVKCPLCEADDYKLRYPATLPGYASSSSPGEMNPVHYRCTSHDLGLHGDIVQCRQCGMIYNNPQPDPGRLLDIYKEVQDPLYLEETAARVHTFNRSLNQLHQYIQPPGKLLDVGCYTGVFMSTAAQAGWEVEGVELSSWAAEIAQKTGTGTIYEEPLDQLLLPGNAFDVVALWDVLEHLTDPRCMLKNVRRLLKPGGTVAISTHMVDSWAVRLLGTRYPFFMEMHVVHFSRATVARLLEEEGFQLLKIQSHPRILRTGYFLEKLYHKVKIAPVPSLLKWLAGKKWVADRFIRVGLLGLVNIFARKLEPASQPEKR